MSRSTWTRRWFGVLAAGWLGALSTQEVRAALAPTEPGAEQPRPLVELTVLATPEEFERLKLALGASTRSNFELRWTRAFDFQPQEVLQPSLSSAPPTTREGAAPVGPRLRCWIDLRDKTRARLYFSRPSSERFLVRALPLSGASSEMDRETLAQVVELSLDALSSDEHAGMGREEATSVLAAEVRAPKPEPTGPAAASNVVTAQPPAPESTWRVRPRLAYALAAYSPQLPLFHGPAAQLALEDVSRQRVLGAGVRFGYLLPQRYEYDRLDVVISMVTVRGDAHVLFPLAGGALQVGPQLSFGADFTWVTPTSRGGADLQPLPIRATPVWVFATAVAVHMPLGVHQGVLLELQLEVDPERVHYDIEAGQSRQTVLERWLVRPGLLLGATLW